MGGGVLPRHERRAIGAADRQSGDRIHKLKGFPGEFVDLRGVCVRIALVSKSLSPPLIPEHKDHVRTLPAPGDGSLQKCPATNHRERKYIV